MNILVYADESGVFDKVHNDIFVFGGLIFLSYEDSVNAQRRYTTVERTLREEWEWSHPSGEMKAIYLNNKQKSALFRAMNSYVRFGVVIRQGDVYDELFDDKKSKQRYLDFAFKIGLKRSLERLIEDGAIDPASVKSLKVFMDEHTTATNGIYELREALEQEFKLGTHNYESNRYFPPLFPNINRVDFTMRDSCRNSLIRAADITANRLYYAATSGNFASAEKILFISLPRKSG